MVRDTPTLMLFTGSGPTTALGRAAWSPKAVHDQLAAWAK